MGMNETESAVKMLEPFSQELSDELVLVYQVASSSFTPLKYVSQLTTNCLYLCHMLSDIEDRSQVEWEAGTGTASWCSDEIWLQTLWNESAEDNRTINWHWLCEYTSIYCDTIKVNRYDHGFSSLCRLRRKRSSTPHWYRAFPNWPRRDSSDDFWWVYQVTPAMRRTTMD